MSRVPVVNRVASTRNNSILRNGNFEVKPDTITAQTNTANRWIDGTAAGSTAKSAYRWAAPSSGSGIGANAAAGFDTTVFRSGTASMKLSTLNASGTALISNILANPPTAGSAYQAFRLQPSVTYRLTGYIRTNNVAANSAYIDFREFSSAFATLATTSTNKLSGTDTSWRTVTATITTNASAVFGCLFLRLAVAGNTSDAWFDDITIVPTSTGRVST